MIDKEKPDSKLATLEAQRKALIERRDRIVATRDRQEEMASTLDAILRSGPVGYGPGTVALGSEDIAHERDEDGRAIVEDWAWPDVASMLINDAAGVPSGRSKSLNRGSVLWCRRLAEVFDIRVTIYGKDEEARPLWRIEGSFPLTPADDSLYTSPSYGGIA